MMTNEKEESNLQVKYNIKIYLYIITLYYIKETQKPKKRKHNVFSF